MHPQQSTKSTNQEGEESCRSCLYTGVATCVGLSAYFAHLAFEDEADVNRDKKKNPIRGDRLHKHQFADEHTIDQRKVNSQHKYPKIDIRSKLMKSFQNRQPQLKSNRPFLLVCSACWAAAGAYRWYLN